jgi:predicted nucleic acid binding AN1-type Zn finger protein
MYNKKRSRCHCDGCKKKVNIMGFACKCGNRYCISHFQPEKHACKYDYTDKLQLSKKLIKMDASKVPPI